MKQYIYLLLFIFSTTIANAQRVSKIAFSYAGVTDNVCVSLDDNAIINLSPKGDIINYGMEYFSERATTYSRLENYNGRIEMYAPTDDKAFAGKLKYIGRTAITYYASYEEESLRGKVKMIGNLIINYYLPFENEAERGNIKMIGSNSFTYYSSFENEEIKGKLKSVGNTNISYYSSFDDKAYKGKLKSIGQVTFTYYPSYDRQFAGSMKTGNQLQNIVGGINYVIR